MNQRTRRSLEEVKAYYKGLKAERAQNRVLVAAAKAEREIRSVGSIPPKKRTKLRGPITKHSAASFGANVFRTCPGGARDEARSGAGLAIMKQIAAAKTGCRVASRTEEVRLRSSARNAWTTYGSYN